ncbi:MAG: Xaa-Pro dipeptidase [Alphaproteobacteria bacterium RIFCSPHIGHO2_12_FULL_63_12]|nr:MAG: Xaa-Pro dipeptidase [Alphaproteobacteria bacterium RIFCSPHIGHO2_12_FULL_63_12]
MKALIPFAAALTALAAPAAGAEISYVHAGRLIDVATGRLLADQLIRIEDGRIAAIGPYVAPADGAPVIDWSSKTVLPGLIDMHTHLVGDIQSAGVADPLLTSGAQDALIGAANAKKTLRAGFTTVRDVGAWRAFTDVALRDAINAGFVDGPRMAVSGGYFTIPGGGGAITGLADDIVLPAEYEAGIVRGAEDAREKARTFLQHHVDFLKMIATGAVLTVGTDPGLPELSEDEMRAIVEEAKKYGKKTTAHAHGAEGAKMAIRAGVASIEHGSLLDDEALSMMKKRGVVLVADIYNGDYIDEVGTRDGWPAETLKKNRDTTDTQRDVFRKAVKMGVKIAYGTDSGVYPHGDNAKQLPYMVKYGMTPIGAIRAATLSAAELLGWEKDVGSIRVGRYADMIAVDGDPLTDISVLVGPKIVIKGGEIVD